MAPFARKKQTLDTSRILLGNAQWCKELLYLPFEAMFCCANQTAISCLLLLLAQLSVIVGGEILFCIVHGNIRWR